jgi:hypothetical protein
MPNEEDFSTKSQLNELPDDRQRAIDELGRRAGEALRTPAPDSGASAIMRRARQQRIVRAGGAVVGVLVVVAIAAIVFGVVDRDREPADNDITDDTVAARSALVEPAELGDGWTISHEYDGLTSRGVADVASRVPECAPYLDYAFDSPSRQSVTTGRIFNGPTNFSLTQWVYIFPTAAAASTAMDKIAEESFQPCFNKFMDALFAVLAPDFPAHSKSIDPPVVAEHGDRQVVVAQTIQFPGSRFSVMNAFIQVGRGIVYVDPTIDTDAGGDVAPVDEAYSVAADALKAALDQT